jgi:hypothetical protein
MGARGLAIGATVVALALAGCGGKEPPPFKEVPQARTQATETSPAGGTQVGGTVHDTITNLGPRYNRVFAQLIDARDALESRADAVTAAASDAQALANQIARGYNPPSGSAPQVRRLRDAVSSFSLALHAILTSSAQLPRLSTELQVRSSQVAKRRPRRAAALLTAQQAVDATIAEVAGLDRAIDVAEAEIRQQLSSVRLDGDALQAATKRASESSTAAVAKVDDAVDSGFEELVAAS